MFVRKISFRISLPGGRKSLNEALRNSAGSTGMKILSEFRSLIPPLSHDELTTLEQSILAEGVRDSLVVGRWPDPEHRGIN
jgi:hypothetical protein